MTALTRFFSERPVLENSSKRLLLVHGTTGLAGVLSGLFINVFFWRLLKSWESLAWYNLIVFAGLLFLSPMAAALTGRWSTRNVMRWGIALQALFYFLILLLGQETKAWLLPLGALNGVANAFFWTGMNVQTSHVSQPTQNWYLSLLQGVYAALAIVGPPISGLVIALWPDYTGYSVVFGITVGLFVAAFLLVGALPADGREAFRIRKVLEVHVHDRKWRLMSVPTFLWGFRQATFDLLVGILTYVTLKSEAGLGSFTMVVSALAIAGSTLVGRLIKSETRPWFFVFGMGSLFVGTVIFVVFRQPWALMVYGLLEATGRGPWTVTFDSYTWATIGASSANKTDQPNRLEYIIHRETLIESGRIAGLALFLVLLTFLPADLVATFLLPFLCMAFGVTFFSYKKYERLVSVSKMAFQPNG